nr:tetratricopeptide repeat protein [Microbulbifer sp. GX H0434]
MKALLETIPEGPPGYRLDHLMTELESRAFSVYYDANATLPAAEVFSRRRGNCMAFSALMVAMARELGIEAHFNQVMVPATWQLESEQIAVYRHVNVVADAGRGQRVIDFNFTGYSADYRQRQLTDAEAFARYYSNISMELLDNGDYREAHRYLQKALQLNPGDTTLWNNLGVIYRRAGEASRARSAYLIALQQDDENLSAMANLEQLSRAGGELALADNLSHRLTSYRRKNPYFWYTQALKAYRRGDYTSAADSAENAISIEDLDHRFHFLLGMARFRLGDSDYRGEFRTAMKLADSDVALSGYRRKMDLLGEEIAASPRRERRHPNRAPLWWWWH